MSSVFNTMIPTNKTRVPSAAIRNVYKARWFIFGFYLLAFCGCIYPAVLLSGSVSQESKAPKGTASAEALEIFESFFPESATITGIIVYVKPKNSVDTIVKALQNDFEKGQEAYYAEKGANAIPLTADDFLTTWNNNYTNTKSIDSNRGGYANVLTDDRYNMFDFNLEYYCRGYEMNKGVLDSAYIARNPTPNAFYGEVLYTMNAQGPAANTFDPKHNFTLFNSFSSYRAVVFAQLAEPVGRQYTSSVHEVVSVPRKNIGGGATAIPVDIHRSAYIIISLKPGANDQRVIDFADKLQKEIMPKLLSLHKLDHLLEFTVISAPSFFTEIGTSIGNDMSRMTTIVIPIAFVIFAIALSSGRLALLPLSVFATSFVISMAIMYGVASTKTMGVNSLAPGIIMMFTTALTMDFCFFIASQWKRVIIEQVRELLMFGQEGAFGLGVGTGGITVYENSVSAYQLREDGSTAMKPLNNNTDAFSEGSGGDGSTRSSRAFSTAADFNQLLSQRRLVLGPKDDLGAPINKKSKRAAGGSAQQKQQQQNSNDDYVGMASTTDASETAVDLAQQPSGSSSSAMFALKTTAKQQFKQWSRSASSGTANTFQGHELCEEIDRIEVMKRVFSAAGKTLIVATIAIILSALGICAFSVDLISSIGVTVVVCTFVTGVTSAILPATLLLTFHSFFFGTLERWCNVIRPDNVTTPLQQRIRADDNISESLLGGPAMFAPRPKREETEAAEGKTGGADNNAGESKMADDKGEVGDHNNATGSPSSIQPTAAQQAYYDNTEAELALLMQVAETSASNTKKRTAFYRGFVRFIIAGPVQSIIIAVVSIGLLLFFAISGASSESYVYSSNVKQFIPANSAIVDGWDSFQRDFPPGSLFSYNLLQLYPSIMSFQSADFFAQQHFAVKTIASRLPQTRLRNIEGTGYSGVLSENMLAASGGNITLAMMSDCYVQQMVTGTNAPLCGYLLLLTGLFTSQKHVSPAITYLSIALEFDPTEQNPGSDWYFTAVEQVLPYLERTMPFVTASTSSAAEAEAAADAYLAAHGGVLPATMAIKLHLRGSPGETFDTVKYATKALTTIIAVAVPIIFIVVFFAFGSLMIALRVLVTVALTVAAVFSITASVYTNDVLSFLNVNSVRGHGSMMWQMPFIVILLSAAVVLNYELISTAKIVDFRWKNIDGLGSTKTAIETGFAIVGREVTVAGTMMMVVFFGFLLSQVSALNQIGFVLFVTAFFSAFWVRLFVTPTVMGLLGEFNWFPLTLLPERFRPPPPLEMAQLQAMTRREREDDDARPRLHSAIVLGGGAHTTSTTAGGESSPSVVNRGARSATMTEDEHVVGMAEMETRPNLVSTPPAPGATNKAEAPSSPARSSAVAEQQQLPTFAVNAIGEVIPANEMMMRGESSGSVANSEEGKGEGEVTLAVNANGVSVTVDQTFEDM